MTGGSGFIAGWCIVELLRQGYDVRTTARDLGKEPRIRAAVAGAVDPGDRLTVVAADLTSDTGWGTAMSGCDRVLHAASPMGTGGDSKDPDELIVPARDGTLRVLSAAARAGIDRVSCAAATPPADTTGGVFDESVWTDLDNPRLDTYRRSKAISERVAWDYIAERGGSTSFATVLPGAVFGPVLSSDGLGSVQVIGRMLRGMPGVPRIGLNIVDVRDVADLHVRAMVAPAAAGERFIAVGGFLWMSEVAAELRRALGTAAGKVSTRTLPDFALRAMARFEPSLRGVVPMLGRRYSTRRRRHARCSAGIRVPSPPRSSSATRAS